MESKTDIIDPNSYSKVRAREAILGAQDKVSRAIDEGVLESRMDRCVIKHYFTALNEQYGCCILAREMSAPKGTIIFGKIHKYQHLNFILKGKISVLTEFGKKYFAAPCTMISEPGVKRVGYVEEDVIWTTVHLTKYSGEENLDKIEDEVIAKDYAEIGLIDSTQKLLGESK